MKYYTMALSRKKETEQNRIKYLFKKTAPSPFPLSKNIYRGREEKKKRSECERRKRKQAFYNFKEKEAVEWAGENIYSGN